MPMPFLLLKCLGQAVLKAGVKAIPFGEVIIDAYNAWSKEKDDEAKRRAEVQDLAQAPPQDVNAQVKEVVREIAADRSAEEQQTLVNYLTLVPSAIRQSQRCPQDPSGRAVSKLGTLSRAQDLQPLLPPSIPRFKVGDRPPGFGDWC